MGKQGVHAVPGILRPALGDACKQRLVVAIDLGTHGPLVEQTGHGKVELFETIEKKRVNPVARRPGYGVVEGEVPGSGQVGRQVGLGLAQARERIAE